MKDEAMLDILNLNAVPGLGPRLMMLLLERFDSASAVLAASGSELLDVPGIGPKLSAEITKARTSDAGRRELDRCRAAGIDLIPRGSESYPKMLSEICDPPIMLSRKGAYLEVDQLAIGIVGSRHCTMYGRQQAERLAGSLARAGFTVVSGLARGIDAAAHRGALKAGGRTIAVCATGLGTIYPPEHVELAGEITQHGCLLTESPLDRGPSPGIFPQRNRIISGLSLGVIIIEANRKSGALHTARHANEQGREVFVVPGRIDNPSSLGCHDLIRDGAQLIRGVDDVIEALGPLTTPVARDDREDVVLTPRELTLNDQERMILNSVGTEPTAVDDVLRNVSIEHGRVLATLTVLEMKRLVRRLPGGQIIRVSH